MNRPDNQTMVLCGLYDRLISIAGALGIYDKAEIDILLDWLQYDNTYSTNEEREALLHFVKVFGDSE